MKAPRFVLRFLSALRLWKRPHYLCEDVEDEPEIVGLRGDLLFREVRGGYAKWAHLKCPRCGELISLPIVGRGAWRLEIDWLRRPTVDPSIWQTGSCGAHFYVRQGRIDWV